MTATLSTLQGASRESLEAARKRLDGLFADGSLAGDAAGVLAADLAGIAGVLGREVSLRRVFTDPSRPAAQKAELASALLGGKVGDPALDAFRGLVSSRWSQPRDIATAVEVLAVQAELADAERAGALDDVEDELFRLGRIVAAQPALADGLSERHARDARVALLRDLLANKVSPYTLRLTEGLVADPRGRTVVDGLDELVTMATARRERLIALVRAARPLTDTQRSRLVRALGRLYGRTVQLNVVIDPAVVAGLTVQVGDEVIDGSVAGRLAEAARRLAG
jgi:F-type H+-transporting ATPase subunit delta